MAHELARAGWKLQGVSTDNGSVFARNEFEECWRPSFALSLVPKITALKRDLEEYLTCLNDDRAHTGRLTNGRIPADIFYGAGKMAAAG